MDIIVNQHDLVHSDSAGNGFHGNCKHCGLAFVTDLGYCSWDDTTCIDRTVLLTEYHLPKEITSKARFFGFIFDKDKGMYIKPYTDIQLKSEDILNYP